MFGRPIHRVATFLVLALFCNAARSEPSKEVTLKGSLVCNGACVAEPKTPDHVMVLYVIDGSDEVRQTAEKLVNANMPDAGLDAEASQKLMDAFDAELKYFLAPDSPALQSANRGESHYCQPAANSAVTGVVSEHDGKRWIRATRIEPAELKYPARLLMPDRPARSSKHQPLVLTVTDKLSLKCVPIPAGKFMMGTPCWMWPYFQEEFPHVVTLTRPFFLSEIPVTQDLYVAVMGNNPSEVKDSALPVENPAFASIEEFCQRLSKKTGLHVRLPSDAEWEYAARVGTSNPGFAEKYVDQNSAGPDGFKSVLPVKSRKPNAWGLYDMTSSWWEITGDQGMYNVRHSETDPRYTPAQPEGPTSQRNGRGLLKEGWSIVTHEFITQKGYAGQKFRVLIEADANGDPLR